MPLPEECTRPLKTIPSNKTEQLLRQSSLTLTRKPSSQCYSLWKISLQLRGHWQTSHQHLLMLTQHCQQKIVSFAQSRLSILRFWSVDTSSAPNAWISGWGTIQFVLPASKSRVFALETNQKEGWHFHIIHIPVCRVLKDVDLITLHITSAQGYKGYVCEQHKFANFVQLSVGNVIRYVCTSLS